MNGNITNDALKTEWKEYFDKVIELNPESEWLEIPVHVEDGSDIFNPFE